MKSFDAARRDLLKLSTLGMAVSLPANAFTSEPGEAGKPSLIFDIRSFGALGDGKTLDTAAINAAIEAAAAAGGGTVYFPGGTWLSFSIRLKSNVELYLAQGARLLAGPVTKAASTMRQSRRPPGTSIRTMGTITGTTR